MNYRASSVSLEQMRKETWQERHWLSTHHIPLLPIAGTATVNNKIQLVFYLYQAHPVTWGIGQICEFIKRPVESSEGKGLEGLDLSRPRG
jgi:hypothetical protein